jgi:hypothetical protein
MDNQTDTKEAGDSYNDQHVKYPEPPSDFSVVPKKFRATLCADCEQLLCRQEWLCHAPEPHFQLLSELVPIPRLRPGDLESTYAKDIIGGCQFCEQIFKQLVGNDSDSISLSSAETPDLSKVEHFEWVIKLYKNGFVELWLGYKLNDGSYLRTLTYILSMVPVTGSGWSDGGQSHGECNQTPQKISATNSLNP